MLLVTVIPYAFGNCYINQTLLVTVIPDATGITDSLSTGGGRGGGGLEGGL